MKLLARLVHQALCAHAVSFAHSASVTYTCSRMHLLTPHRHLLSPVILLYHPFCCCRFSVMVAAQHLMLWSKMHYYARWV